VQRFLHYLVQPPRHLGRQVVPPVTTRSLAEVGVVPDAGLVLYIAGVVLRRNLLAAMASIHVTMWLLFKSMCALEKINCS
jgi:hypothetical protein